LNHIADTRLMLALIVLTQRREQIAEVFLTQIARFLVGFGGR